MAKIDDLNAKIDELQATIDADQAGDAAVVAALQAEVDRLTAAQGTGLSADEVDATISRLEAIKGDVSGPNA